MTTPTRSLSTLAATVVLLLGVSACTPADPVDYEATRTQLAADISALPGVDSVDLKVHDGGPFSDPAVSGKIYTEPDADLEGTVQSAYSAAVSETLDWSSGRITLTARVAGDDSVIVDARTLGFDQQAVSLEQAREAFGG